MKRHYYWLDAIRFLAAFMVVAGHARSALFVDWPYMQTDGTLHYILSLGFFTFTKGGAGHYCVMLFFALSGFLVGGKLPEGVRERTFNARSYFTDRFARIVPPLAIAIVWIVASNALIGRSNDPKVALGNLFSLQGIFTESLSGPFWSLSYEVWFYMAGGLWAMYSLAREGIVKSLLLAGTVASAMVFLRLDYVYALVWCMGALAYRGISQSPKAGFALFYALSAFATMCSGLYLVHGHDGTWVMYAVYLIFALFISLMLQQLAPLKPRGRFPAWIDCTGSKLALFSYTLYLTHYQLLEILSGLGLQRAERFTLMSFVIFIIAVGACLLLAWLLYLPGEKQTYRIKSIIKRLFGWN